MRRIAAVLVVLSMSLLPGTSPAHHLDPPESGGPDGGPALAPPAAASPDGHLFDWDAEPAGIAGRGTHEGDEFVFSDYPFDDTGADLDGSDGQTTNPLEYVWVTHGANAATSHAGDFTYPGDAAFAGNGADIVEVRMGVDAHAWYLLVVLNTLIDPSRTAVLATLGDPNTDGPAASLLMHGQTGSLDGTPVTVVADAAQNTFEARIPHAVLDPRAGERDLFVGAGLWDPATGDWIRPDPDAPPLFDLIGVDESDATYWNDLHQSRVLADGSYANATVRIDVASLANPCSTCVRVEAVFGGRKTFVRTFKSSQSLGEGVEEQTLYNQDESFDYRFYRSAYQPYSVYEPCCHQGPRPLVILMHFLGGNYMSYPITSFPLQARRWADELGATVVMPHGRGEAGWYEGPAERDVFEVWRDAARHYDIDRERVYLSGMSMGGYGTWRLAALYPDQFAAGIVWAGPTTPYAIWPAPAPVTWPYPNPPMCDRDASGCGFSLTDVFDNLDHVPMFVIHGGADELVPSTGPEGWMAHFDAVGGSYRYVLYPNHGHETSYPGTTDGWVREWLGDLPKRQRSPTFVEYTVVADLQQEGLTYDGAYWVDGLRLAGDALEGRIAVNLAEGDLDVAVGPRAGADELGAYVLRGRERRQGTSIQHTIRMDVRGLRAAELDTSRMFWPSKAPRLLLVETDAAMTVVLRGSFDGDTTIEVLSGEATAEVAGGNIVISIPAGTTELSIGSL